MTAKRDTSDRTAEPRPVGDSRPSSTGGASDQIPADPRTLFVKRVDPVSLLELPGHGPGKKKT